jgi:hypothetical protein
MPFPPVPVRGVATFFPADTRRRNSPLALFSKIFPLKNMELSKPPWAQNRHRACPRPLVATCKTMLL